MEVDDNTNNNSNINEINENEIKEMNSEMIDTQQQSLPQTPSIFIINH